MEWSENGSDDKKNFERSDYEAGSTLCWIDGHHAPLLYEITVPLHKKCILPESVWYHCTVLQVTSADGQDEKKEYW
jgi:hypothetical protein